VAVAVHMVGCTSGGETEEHDDGKLHGQLITCQPEAAENLRLNGDTSHVKALEMVDFRGEVETLREEDPRKSYTQMLTHLVMPKIYLFKNQRKFEGKVLTE
jgi:hypothetical protein